MGSSGMKHISEFNDDEKSAIVTESVVNFVNKEVLSQKYNTMPHVIGYFVHGMGFKVPPKDMSEYPDWPRKSNEMSLDEYRKVIRKYWNNKNNRNNKSKIQEKKKASTELRVQQSLEN